MAFRKIDVDDDVFALLQRHSVPLVDTPNDVLRRLLLEGVPAAVTADGDRRAGALLPLLEFGLVQAGDMLRHRQPRLNRTHEATITADGWVELPDARAYARPSPALKAQTGSDINGWGQYIHVPTGRSLQELREEAARRAAEQLTEPTQPDSAFDSTGRGAR